MQAVSPTYIDEMTRKKKTQGTSINFRAIDSKWHAKLRKAGAVLNVVSRVRPSELLPAWGTTHTGQLDSYKDA